MEDIVLKQRAFFESGNTLDTRSRRAMLQILANTVKEIAGEDSDTSGILESIADIRNHLYKWSGTGKLRMLLSLFAQPKGGPVPLGNVLIDASQAGGSLGAILSPLVQALAAGNTAVVIVPDSPAGKVAANIIDDTFTDDFVAVADAADADGLKALPFDFIHSCTEGISLSGQDGFLAFSK